MLCLCTSRTCQGPSTLNHSLWHESLEACRWYADANTTVLYNMALNVYHIPQYLQHGVFIHILTFARHFNPKCIQMLQYSIQAKPFINMCFLSWNETLLMQHFIYNNCHPLVCVRSQTQNQIFLWLLMYLHVYILLLHWSNLIFHLSDCCFDKITF